MVALFCYRYFDRIKEANEKQTIIWVEYGLILLVATIIFSAYHSLRIQRTTHAFNPNYPAAREVTIDVEIIQCSISKTSMGQIFAIVVPVNHELARIQKKEQIFLSIKPDESLSKYWQ